ncbi:MAG: sigma-70 family RNA polymerase sigma factor [Tannerellaceae bacterium]|jgi:RNA polymerase sigma-70 factor (ECF subfamily)|nr:sigma-70 family RNA polymerase sigma factor [Tannerellaceae bacterium]
MEEEERLIYGCIRGESWACEGIYKAYAPAMMSLCMRYVNDRETARDLVQEGFIKVFGKIGAYSASGAFGGWVRRIFVTTSLEHLRRKDTWKYAGPVDECAGLMESVETDVMDRLSADDLLDCIAQLPAGYRTVFNMYAIEGYSHKEIAASLGISEITSRTQFIRARNVLQKCVQSLIENENAGKERAKGIF